MSAEQAEVKWRQPVSAWTHFHSGVCQLSARNPARRHICSCPACSHSAAHTGRCRAPSTRPSLASERSQNWSPTKTLAHFRPLTRLTLEKVGREAGFVDGSVGDELQPELVGAAFDVVRFVVAAEASEQRAAVRAAIPHLHVIIRTAVVPFNLQSKRAQWVTHSITHRRQKNQRVVFSCYFNKQPIAAKVTWPQTTEMTRQRRTPLLLWFSTHTLCWTGSRRDNWETGSGHFPAAPRPHTRLHGRWEMRLFVVSIQRNTSYVPQWLHLHRQLRSLCPPSCCCFWIQSTVDCQWRRLDQEECLRRNGLSAQDRDNDNLPWRKESS